MARPTVQMCLKEAPNGDLFLRIRITRADLNSEQVFVTTADFGDPKFPPLSVALFRDQETFTDDSYCKEAFGPLPSPQIVGYLGFRARHRMYDGLLTQLLCRWFNQDNRGEWHRLRGITVVWADDDEEEAAVLERSSHINEFTE